MAQPQQDEGVAVAGDAVTLFGEGGEVGLVLDEDAGLGEPFLEGRDQVPVPCGQSGGVAEFAGGGVDQAGRADADGVQSAPPLDELVRGGAPRVPASFATLSTSATACSTAGAVPVSPPIGTDASART